MTFLVLQQPGKGQEMGDQLLKFLDLAQELGQVVDQLQRPPVRQAIRKSLRGELDDVQ